MPFLPLFLGITCGIIPYLSPVPRIAVRHIALSQIALHYVFAYLGLLKYPLSEVR